MNHRSASTMEGLKNGELAAMDSRVGYISKIAERKWTESRFRVFMTVPVFQAFRSRNGAHA